MNPNLVLLLSGDSPLPSPAEENVSIYSIEMQNAMI
jgi:hypothetical protein